MNEVWLVLGNCGDYYCGCGQGHVVGCCSTEERAARMRVDLMNYPRMGGPNPEHFIAGKRMNYGPYSELTVYGPVKINEVNAPEFSSGFRET